MSKLTDKDGNRMCSVCSQNRSITKDTDYCLDCQSKSNGFTNCLNALKKQSIEIQNIHYFLYSKNVDTQELMNAIRIIDECAKKLTTEKLYKVEQSSIYGIALNI